MHLKSLEIIGFKSFATKTILDFHHGVTAVVGPNGCGKSNILDAIRWVLGEQSAKALRGGEMADVIFSGTDTRQAHNMAEVSLVFGDCEEELGVSWNELRITRRIFRDGKSEYLLNGVACRLKDIHETFMDTGIGRSAYSIMEQGKLDQILSSRPEERRSIFEEAAGITKFKSQKKEALRKLEYTESNLLRVTDIIKEVKRQIGSLQRQAAKARRYQQIMGELRVLDTHAAHHHYQRLEKNIQELLVSLEEMSRQRLTQEERIASEEEQVVVSRKELATLDQRLEEKRDYLQTVHNRIFSGESRIQTHQERQEEHQSFIERARVECDSFSQRIREEEKAKDQMEKELQELLHHLSLEEKLLQESVNRCAMSLEERQKGELIVKKLSDQIHHLENGHADLREKISTLLARRDSAEQRLTQVRVQQSEVDKIFMNLKERVSTTGEAHAKIKQRVDDLQKELALAQSSYESRQLDSQQAERDWNEVSKQLMERRSREEVLSELERQGEGLAEGTQAILHGLDQPDFFKTGILGTLASLTIVASEDVAALEAALGAASHAVVFNNEEIAQVALRSVKEKAQGRAALLLLMPEKQHQEREEKISLKELQELRFKMADETIQWASSLISAVEPLDAALHKLLEGVLVVEKLETAFCLKKMYPHLAFATRDGEFISHQGLLFGGHDGKKSSSALLRRSQITRLEREIVSLQEEEKRLAAARDFSVSLLGEASSKLKELRESLTHQQMLLATAQGDERLARRELEETEARYRALGLEVQMLNEQIHHWEEQSTLHERELEEFLEKLRTFHQEHSLAQHRMATLRDAESDASRALAEIRLRVATERQRQEILTQRSAPIQARLQELKQSIDHRQRDINQYEEKRKNLLLQSQELTQSLAVWKGERAQLEEEITILLRQRTELQNSLEVLESTLRSLRDHLFNLQDRRAQEEVKLAQLHLHIESTSDQITRRYQVDLKSFQRDESKLQSVFLAQQGKKDLSLLLQKQHSDDFLSSTSEAKAPNGVLLALFQEEGISEEVFWEKVQHFIEELTARLDGMGPVNIDAIEEYEELEERSLFLEKQYTDLIHGKKELLETMTRINKTTRELFATTFERIRVNFQEMFAELFGGGRADLILADESDPLESGIEMVARPPGKQLQSISLLSGGERTMTAVALLFAIYMVKPSPFCVLDEMDAPLDESNIGRFIKLLDRFVGQSQFFVITHHKRTMSRADMIYGVTMEEQGVTKLLSMKFQGKENREE